MSRKLYLLFLFYQQGYLIHLHFRIESTKLILIDPLPNVAHAIITDRSRDLLVEEKMIEQ